MGTQHLSFDLYLWLSKEYNKLMKRAEELMRSILLRPNDWPMGSINSFYLKAGGQFGPIKFINTCVPDSLLIALYCCYVQHEHVASLFNSSEKLRAPMVFLRAEMYDAAKASLLYRSQFSVTKNTSERDQYVIDAWSEPGDHLHIFNELIVRNDKLSKLKHLGNVYALGFYDLDPLFVLVDICKGMNTAPSLHIEDDYYRPYELQFLLMSRRSFPNHMIGAQNRFNRWVVYDNEKSSYVDFNITQADFKGDFIIHNAGYVKTQNVPIGVAEEGYCGTVPFNRSRGSQKEHID